MNLDRGQGGCLPEEQPRVEERGIHQQTLINNAPCAGPRKLSLGRRERQRGGRTGSKAGIRGTFLTDRTAGAKSLWSLRQRTWGGGAGGEGD